MSVSIDESYRRCAQAARRAASNFYWSFWLLPRNQRRAMYALYAFSRHTDDLADGAENGVDRGAALADWRTSVAQAFEGLPSDALLPALVDTVRRYDIPRDCLDTIIDGVAMDLAPRHYQTFDELSEYCRRVATAVGLACIRIWGYEDDRVFATADSCGLAFQMTNILRDLKEDAQRGRIYLPLDDLARFDYAPEELSRGVVDKRFTALMRFEIERTREFYRASEATARYLSPAGRRVFGLMFSTYRALLDEIERRGGDVFGRRIRVRTSRRLSAAVRQLFGAGRTYAK